MTISLRLPTKLRRWSRHVKNTFNDLDIAHKSYFFLKLGKKIVYHRGQDIL